MQNSDGGWPVWRRGEESWPFHSIHAANALQRAKQKGYTVPPEMLDQAKSYLRNIESSYPSSYPEDVRRTLTAYALNVRKQMGDADPAPGPFADQGSRPGKAFLRGHRLAPAGAQRRSELRGRSRGHPPLPAQSDDRDGGRRALRHVVRRQRLPAAPLQPPGRRDHPGCADRRPTAERPDPEDRAWAAGAAEGRPLGQHPGERLHPAGAGSLLQHLRVPDARLRCAHLAGRAVRRRSEVPAAARPTTSRSTCR